MPSGRLLIVSNRLPVTARQTGAGVVLAPSGGGLATGLRPWHASSKGLWIGWPGDVSRFSAALREDLDRQLAAEAIVPVHLSRDLVDRHYHGFANRVVWPLFHYLVDRVPVDATGWSAYQQANEIFADAVAREHRPGDVIWVHDYQLMLLPAMLRERLPGARIGFFLHIPFPSPEVFRILPWRGEMLHGLLGADLVGFHTFAYLRHFLSSVHHVNGAEVDLDRVRFRGREVRLGAFPMGIDAERFAEIARDPEVLAEAAAIRRDAGGRTIVLGIDRLDYTKGIPRRLQAIERLLERDPALRDRLRYIQVAVPSRSEVDSYRRFKRQVEERVGRINGASGTLRSTPIHYVHQSVSRRQLVALYCAADVMLVTPLRDGMNLVAKEFIASRVDEDGALVLSEFAGAAAELDGAIIVNAYDVDAIAGGIEQALAMPPDERRTRMRALRGRVARHDIHAWAGAFMAELGAAGPADVTASSGPEAPLLDAALASARQSARIRLLLDYDGTLVPIARAPELAAPDAELLAMLETLAARPGVRIDIVSGRPRETLEAWLGHLPVALWAEHALWHRPAPGQPWSAATDVAPDWMPRVKDILDQFAAATPGSHVEVKSASMAWHYRRARPEFAARQAHELRLLLGQALGQPPFEVLQGKSVIEVRPHGISKAAVARRIRAGALPGTAVIAIGDDRTDDDLFEALPASSVTIAVGRRATRARFRVDDTPAVRLILRSLLTGGVDRTPAAEAVRESILPA